MGVGQTQKTSKNPIGKKKKSTRPSVVPKGRVGIFLTAIYDIVPL